MNIKVLNEHKHPDRVKFKQLCKDIVNCEAIPVVDVVNCLNASTREFTLQTDAYCFRAQCIITQPEFGGLNKKYIASMADKKSDGKAIALYPNDAERLYRALSTRYEHAKKESNTQSLFHVLRRKWMGLTQGKTK